MIQLFLSAITITVVGVDANNLRGGNVLEEFRIINGEPAQDQRFPFFSMLWGDGGLCGGALIAPDMVITAAHCRDAANEVIIGRHDRINMILDTSETIPIAKKTLYPEYPSYNNYLAYDLMLVKLNGKSNKPFVKIRNAEPNPEERLTVIGFGNSILGSRPVIPEKLLEVELGYISQEQCQEMHFPTRLSNDMLCALESGKDACSGDSGGPLFIKGETYEQDELVGTVAWGRGCADERWPGVYSRMSWFYNWIREEVCEQSMYPPDYFNCKISMASNNDLPISTDFPTISPTSEPTPVVEGEKLTFVEWYPTEPLDHCQGDCEVDDDCLAGMVCFHRSKTSQVPGCYANKRDYVPSIADFCIYPEDVSQ